MNINPTSPNLPAANSPLLTVNQVATEEVNAKSTEVTSTVTAPVATGDTGSHGGAASQPGLGNHVDVYDTKHKTKLHLLGHEPGMIGENDIPTDPEFPFLIPLGQKKPGQVIDAKI